MFLREIPLAMAGLILSIFASASLFSPSIGLACNIFASILYLIYCLRLVIGFDDLRTNLENPVITSMFATFPMATVLFGHFLFKFVPLLGYIFLGFGLALHIGIAIYYIKTFVLKLDIKIVFPSYYIVFVGLATTTIVGRDFGLDLIPRIIFYLACINYLILTPFIVYRLIKYKQEPARAYPTAIIMTAPGGLLLSSYLKFFVNPNHVFVYILMILAFIAYIYALENLVHVMELPFHPSISSITFPMVITASGFKLGFALLGDSLHFKIATGFMSILGVICVLIALIKYLNYFYRVYKKD